MVVELNLIQYILQVLLFLSSGFLLGALYIIYKE